MTHPKPTPPDEEMRALLITLGLDPDQDFESQMSIDISALPKERWEIGTKVTPPAAILRYLASGDILTRHTVEMMEVAIERAYGVEAPWYIDSTHSGSEEAEDLSVTGFFLMK